MAGPLAALLLLAAGCSGDDNAADTSTSAPTEATSTTLDTEEGIAEARAAIEGLDDPCEIIGELANTSPAAYPDTAEGAKDYIDFTVEVMNRLGDTVDDPAVADTLHTSAEETRAFAESVDYDPAALSFEDSSGLPIDSADDFEAAVSGIYSSCTP